jgi:mono/diheme cytochrome c family protein
VTHSLKLVGYSLGLAVTAILTTGILAPGAAAQASSEGQVSFKEDVFPILQRRCVECHQPGGAGYEKSGFDMTSYEGLMKGTKYGPMIIPGNVIESNLLAMINRKTSPKLWMPHGKKQLSRCDRQAIRSWVAQGALNN